MTHMNYISRPKLSVTIHSECHKFMDWARNQGQFRVSKSAVIEQALNELAKRMGYVTPPQPQPPPQKNRLHRNTADVI